MSANKKKIKPAKNVEQTIASLDADSDASDSDYNPDSDPEADKEVTIDQPKSLLNSGINASRKRKANDLFEEMRLADEAATHATLSKALIRPSMQPLHVNKKVKTGAPEKRKKRISNMLQSVFGSSTMADAENARRNSAKCTVDSNIREQLQGIAKNVIHNQKIVETRKFAGQEITVERTVKIGESSEAVKNTEAARTSNLDKIIEDIKGPQTVSTVTKSVYDWDNFKEKEGLEDELAVAAKDGYLHRQDFLQRCDIRTHDKELESRPPPAPINR